MLRDQKRYQGMWKPQLGPVDETPYKIDRADLQLEELLSGLRGDLALLRAQFSKAQGAGTLTPSTEAIYRRKIARTMYQIWAKSLDHGLIPETVEAYTLALAFPVNADQPIIWWEAANLYLSQGSYEGALSILDRIILDFPDYARINSVLICRAAVYRRMHRFDEAVKDFLTVVQRKLPEPYTFSDIMTHIAWCYELHGDSADNRHHSYDSRGAFATAYQALHDKPADAMRVFGPDISESQPWYKWRRTPMTWLKLAKKHSEAGHIALSADCFNEAGRLRILLDIEEAEAAKKSAEAAEKARLEEEAKAAEAERIANTLSPYQRMLQKQAAAKAKAEAEAAEKARLAQVTYSSDESSSEEEYMDSDDEAAKEKELEREANERTLMDEQDKWSKLHDAICDAEESRIPAAPQPPTMRQEPLDVPQPRVMWKKQVTFDELVRKNLLPREKRKSAVEEAGLWMVASDVYMREDRNEAAHIAAESAVRAANMGDVTASAALMMLSRGSTKLAELLKKRAASHLLALGTRWVSRVRNRLRQRNAVKLIAAAYRQHRYRMRHFARIMLQSRIRGWLKWLRYTRMKKATLPLQCWWRMMRAIWEKCSLQRTRVRWALLVVQRSIRWFIHRQNMLEWLVATTRIQRAFRQFLDRVRGFMWERYHFFAAQELENWVGCNIGSVIVPKKYVRHYEPHYRIPVKSSTLGSAELLAAKNMAAITVASHAASSLAKSNGSAPAVEEKVLWLHPNDRIVRRRVIPTRVEMLAEERVWSRAEHIAEMLAFADVNVQQGAIWGYNDGEAELEEWGGFRTLYMQIRAIRRHRIVGKAVTDPDSVARDGGDTITAKASNRRRPKSSTGGTSAPKLPDVPDDDPTLLSNPGVEAVRTWMRQLKHGVLPSWNRGLVCVWDAFMTGRGTRYYKEARRAWKYQCPHVCAEPMHPRKAKASVVEETSLELTGDVPSIETSLSFTNGRTSAWDSPVRSGLFEEPESVGALELEKQPVLRSMSRLPKLEYTRTLASTGGAGSTLRSSGSQTTKHSKFKALSRTHSLPPGTLTASLASPSKLGDTQDFRHPVAERGNRVLTPIRPVRIGISKHFVFESAGRWGCDLKGWTKGADRFLWDIHLWTEQSTWGIPYGSMDQFVIIQRWLSQVPIELRIWAKKNLDWRTLLDEQLQTALRFVHRSFVSGMRDCVANKVFGDDVSGWYAGWVSRPRKGTVVGALPAARSVSSMQATLDADFDSDDDEPEELQRLVKDSSLIPDASLSGLPSITLRQTQKRLTGGASSSSSTKDLGTQGKSLSASMPSLPSPARSSLKDTRTGSSVRNNTASKLPPPSPVISASPSRIKGRKSAKIAFADSAATSSPSLVARVHPGTLVRYQHPHVVRHEEANALVRKYIDPAFEDEAVNRGTLPGPWLAEGLAELIATVFSSEGMLAPVLAALKRRAMRWYTIQQTSQDGDKLRLRAHDSMLRDLKAERIRAVKAVREERNKRAQEPAVRLAVYRKHKDASQAVKLYKELVQMEAKRRCWSDVIEILQAVSEEPLFRGTTVYLAAVIACALKCAGDVAVNRGLEADGAKFADAKPHADWDGGYGNADEIADLVQVETGLGSFSSASLAVTALGWASKYFIQLERECYLDALRATTIPGGWKDSMFVYKAMKQAGHSMAAPVFDIMTLVCRNTFGKQRAKLYEALKSAGASYALCFMAANSDGV